jgi:hypothetical protein
VQPSTTDPDPTRAWFRNWLAEGPPVCVLRGFSGVGKTWLARKVAQESGRPIAYVEIPDGALLSTEDILFEIAGEVEPLGLDLPSLQVPDADLRVLLEDVMRTPCLVILDNFQEVLDPETRMMPADLARLLHKLSLRMLPGRLLIISNEAVADGDDLAGDLATWRLLPPPEDAARALLHQMLDAQGIADAIPEADLGDVVKWLGANPRALQILAVCLTTEALEDLIELEPEAWESRDQTLSAQLLLRLETRLLQRTLERLGAQADLILQYLSVYRVSFGKEALERLAPLVDDIGKTRGDLISRFLMELHRNRYELNPIVRQIARARLDAQRRNAERAHGLAAGYYTRHFTAKGTDDPLRHGREFVEARFQLARAGREEEFAELAGRFRGRLLSIYQNSLTVPAHPEQVTERIQVLAAALDPSVSGFPVLREFLARLLTARGRPGDDIAALNQMRLAIRESNNQSSWVLYLRLLNRVEGVAAMRTAADLALATLPPQASEQVYIAVAIMLDGAGALADAERIAVAGIGRVPPASAVNLHLVTGALQDKQRRYPESIGALSSLMDTLGNDHSQYHRLLEAVLFVALRHGDAGTLAEVREKLPETGRSLGWRDLVDVLALECAGDYRAAAETASAAIASGRSRYPSLIRGAFCWLAAGEPARASEEFAAIGDLPKNPANDWLGYLIALRNGRAELAQVFLARCLGRHPTEAEAADPAQWLRLWDRPSPLVGSFPCFYYPRLPASLTGLRTDIRRVDPWHSALDPALLGQLAPAAAVLDRVAAPPQPVPAGGITIVNTVSPTIEPRYSTTEIAVSDTYNVGQAGAVGRDARADNAVFNQVTGGDLRALAEELDRVRRHLAPQAVGEEETRELAALEAAVTAAEAGDEPATRRSLAKVGKWVLGAATAVGTSLAAAAIKSAAGL